MNEITMLYILVSVLYVAIALIVFVLFKMDDALLRRFELVADKIEEIFNWINKQG